MMGMYLVKARPKHPPAWAAVLRAGQTGIETYGCSRLAICSSSGSDADMSGPAGPLTHSQLNLELGAVLSSA